MFVSMSVSGYDCGLLIWTLAQPLPIVAPKTATTHNLV
jgi:hypothetical protein